MESTSYGSLSTSVTLFLVIYARLPSVNEEKIDAIEPNIVVPCSTESHGGRMTRRKRLCRTLVCILVASSLSTQQKARDRLSDT